MNIYDCFMYFDEDLLLDIRLNTLDKFVKKFIISEATYTHNGDKKKLNFNINNFSKFKDKINYIIIDNQPQNILKLIDDESKHARGEKLILNGMARDYFQRENLIKGLKEVSDDDLILVSDLDEIPNLETVDFSKINNEILIFEQKIFYYKLNLYYGDYSWHGTKATKSKNFISPQWLRNIKGKNYPIWRLDVLFSDKKYSNIIFIENGGWHFSNMKTADDIEKKMRTYLHHREYDIKPLGTEKIKEIIKNKKSIYNLRADMKADKIDGTQDLKLTDGNELPEFIKKNKEKYSNWIE